MAEQAVNKPGGREGERISIDEQWSMENKYQWQLLDEDELRFHYVLDSWEVDVEWLKRYLPGIEILYHRFIYWAIFVGVHVLMNTHYAP